MFNYQLLKQLRKEFNLSQQEIAGKLGMEQSTYNRYETNKAQPGFHVLEKLKTEFEIEPSEFFISDNICGSKKNAKATNASVKGEAKTQYSVSEEIINEFISYHENAIKLLKKITAIHLFVLPVVT